MDTNTGSTKTTAHAPIAAQPSVRSGALAKWAKLWADIKHNKVSYFFARSIFIIVYIFHNYSDHYFRGFELFVLQHC